MRGRVIHAPHPSSLDQRRLGIGRWRGLPTWAALGQRALEPSLQTPDEIFVSKRGFGDTLPNEFTVKRMTPASRSRFCVLTIELGSSRPH